jgi:oligopeptide/dipeptide ABC transporter ATP-binding protein
MVEERLLSVRDLSKIFPVTSGFGKSRGAIHAVDGVSFDTYPGETLGLVGESGSGKSTIARLILRLHDPMSGSVVFQGRDLAGLDKEQLREVRKDVQIIFQDPFASLDPRMRVADIVAEPLVTHGGGTRKEIEAKVLRITSVVGLKPYQLRQYPHQFSGGQRQRIGIARALTLHPKLVLCDEPVSALDVSIQSQILNLLKDLQAEFNLTYLFISHDLHIVRYMSNRVCVMYMGKIVEQGPTEDVFNDPRHPYTRSLISVVPTADPEMRNREKVILEGELPSALNPPSGCRFRTRCPVVMDICKEKEPPVCDVGGARVVACHLAAGIP